MPRMLVLATTIAVLFAAGPAGALDATGIDIIGLRLGMQEAEVLAQLGQQGYAMSRTTDLIAGNTRDGRLQVTLSNKRGVTEIRYSFHGSSMDEPAKINEAIFSRFGVPDQTGPLMWCKAVGQDRICPSNQPSLTFLPESLTLLLRARADR